MSQQDLPETPFDVEELRRRQRSRSRITGLALLALAALFFLITIAKLSINQ